MGGSENRNTADTTGVKRGAGRMRGCFSVKRPSLGHEKSRTKDPLGNVDIGFPERQEAILFEMTGYRPFDPEKPQQCHVPLLEFACYFGTVAVSFCRGGLSAVVTCRLSLIVAKNGLMTSWNIAPQILVQPNYRRVSDAFEHEIETEEPHWWKSQLPVYDRLLKAQPLYNTQEKVEPRMSYYRKKGFLPKRGGMLADFR
ncbi:hypothetical protein CLF_105553 [Clonorchis sinensis]|uniref:Uncharacterized protein n=1 Tax=Clonorchis sinensis TaxID=79923 RepID=G7YPD9_CLOSI|nr:hypothetical protein CLF_105553 [Clonorchis sinensis]